MSVSLGSACQEVRRDHPISRAEGGPSGRDYIEFCSLTVQDSRKEIFKELASLQEIGFAHKEDGMLVHSDCQRTCAHPRQ